MIFRCNARKLPETKKRAPTAARVRLRMLSVLILTLVTLGLSRASTAAQPDKQIIFNIGATTLSQALLEFGSQAHVQIMFASKSMMGQIQTEKLLGSYTVQQALALLLKGTSLGFLQRGNTVEIVPCAATKRATGASDPGGAVVPQRQSASRGSRQVGLSAEKPQSKRNIAEPALSEVIVTGTHILGTEPTYPVTTITRTDILESGLPTIGDVLRTSPEVFSGGVNPGVYQVGGGFFNAGDSGLGVSTVDLLGIGTDSTLTLINGQRLSGAGITASSASPDLSMIPTVAVQRIEIQTGGSSAVYGSDAVAGVVNIILRNRYDGAETSGYVGWAQGGGGFTQRYSQLAGRTFDRGGILVAAEFDRGNSIAASQRAISVAADPLQLLEPQTKAGSILLNGHYGFTDHLKAHVLALYTHRTATNTNPTSILSSRVDEFSSNAGLTYELDGDRNLGIDVTDSGYSELGDANYLPCPCGSPLVDAEQSGLVGIDVHGSGTLVHLPTGALSAAVGAGMRRESLEDEGNTFSADIFASRRVGYAYLELKLPVVRKSAARTGLEGLDLTASLRRSHYSDFGSATSPAVGFVYTPFRSIVIKATYGKAFRAPTLYELYDPVGLVLFGSSLFPSAPQDRSVLYEVGGNTRLGPERAHSFTTSAEFTQDFSRFDGRFSAAASYYYIHFDSRIAFPLLDVFHALQAPNPFVVLNPTLAQQNLAIADGGGLSYLNNYSGAPYDPGTVLALLEDTNQNVSADVVHGISVNTHYGWTSELGDFRASWTGTWIRFDQRLLADSPPQEIAGTLFNPPDFKMRGSLGWRYGRWTATGFVNRVSGEELPYDGTADTPASVGSWTTVDAHFSVAPGNFDASGIRVIVALSIDNLLNAAPPRVPGSEFFSGENVGFDTANASAIGRFFAVSATVTW